MKHRVLIIGGNLAGLTTALRLASHGHQISILDKKPMNDMRSVEFNTTLNQPETIHDKHQNSVNFSDGPPFILHGFQRETWSLLKELGTLNALTTEKPIPFEFLRYPQRIVRFRPFPLPSPLHSILGLLIFQGLTIKDRWYLLNTLEKLWEMPEDYPTNLDTLSAESWLSAFGQSDQACRETWNPLCQYLLGEHLGVTSASIFSKTLTKCFFSKRSSLKTFTSSFGDSHFLLRPLKDLLQAKGVSFYPSTLVTQFQYDSHKVTGVKLENGTTFTADRYVSTIPPQAFTTFLPERWLAKFSYFCNLAHLQEIPSLVVNFRIFQPSVRPRLLLSSKTFHWMTSQPENVPHHQPTTTISCIATGNSSLLEQPDDRIIKQAIVDIRESLFFRTAQEILRPLNVSIFRQPQAFLSSTPGISTYRPLQQSPISNLFLAGNWTDTGLPASRESSIKSGTLCAQAITNCDRTEFVDKSL